MNKQLAIFFSLLLLISAAISIIDDGSVVRAGDSDTHVSFAVFADPHLGKDYGSYTTAYLTELGNDIMDNLTKLDFVMSVGDDVHHREYLIHGVDAPGSKFNYYWKQDHITNIKIPYLISLGNHDITEYWNYVTDDYGEADDPYVLMDTFLNESIITTPTYAFCHSNILFLCVGDKADNTKIHESQQEWLEYMCETYQDKTIVIYSHNAIRGTTYNSNDRDYRWRHDEFFWWDLFDTYSNIKAYIHGHNHGSDWDVLSINTQDGYAGTNGSWGHDIVFMQPPSQFDPYGNHEKDGFAVINISATSITGKFWRHDGEVHGWSSEYDHSWSVSTSFDDSEDDWYCIPLFLQDGEIQKLNNDVIPSQNITLQMVGVRPYSLFNDPQLLSWDDNAAVQAYFQGFDGDSSGVSLIDEQTGGMQVVGSKTLTFPSTTYGADSWNSGRSGQKLNYLQHGSTAIGVPGATYNISFSAKVTSGSGQIDLVMNCSNWSTGSQHSTLSNSQDSVFSNAFGTSYSTVYGEYTVPDGDDKGFLQGTLFFNDSVTYQVSDFTITRSRSSDTTQDFHVRLNDVWYNQSGSLIEDSFYNLSVDPLNLTDVNGRLVFYADIGGNHMGMVNLFFHYPFLYGRNARFRIMSYDNDTVNLTLKGWTSEVETNFNVMHFSDEYTTFTMSPGYLNTSDNGFIKYGETVYSANKQVEVNFSGLGINTGSVEESDNISFVSINSGVNNSSLDSPNRFFNWTKASGATYYHLQVSNSSGFGTTFINFSNITEGCDFESMPGGSYTEKGDYIEFYLPYVYNISWYDSHYYRVRAYTYS